MNPTAILRLDEWLFSFFKMIEVMRMTKAERDIFYISWQEGERCWTETGFVLNVDGLMNSKDVNKRA